LDNNPEKIPSRQRILDAAIDLFSIKGYKETSIREIASQVGMKEASIYSHFVSKNAIMEHILEEYSKASREFFVRDKLLALEKNPTVEGILNCMMLAFPKGKEQHYLKVLFVILQEQHRDPGIRRIMCEEYILGNEQVVKTIIDTLIGLKVLRPDTDADFWAKMHSSLLYAFANRLLMGIGDSSPGFTGKSLYEMVWKVFDMMLKACSVENTPGARE